MKPDNPAIYKCKSKNLGGLHWWNICFDGTSYCIFCKSRLNKEQTNELKSN